MVKFMKLLYLFIAICYCGITSAQEGNNIEKAKTYYKSRSEKVDLTIQNNKVLIKSHVFETKFFNEIVSSAFSSDRIYHGSFTDVSNINASVFHLNKKGKYKKQPLYNFEDKANFSGGSFYDDNSYFEILYPNIAPSSYTELSYDLKIKDPHFFKRFYFTEYTPSKNVMYSITTDKDIEIGWKLFGSQKEDVKFTKTTEGDKVLYTWELEDSYAYVSENGSPGYMHYATHIVVYVKSYNVKGQEYRVLSNVQDLFDWYQTLIKKIKPTNNETLVKLTQEVIKGSKTDLEKAEKIFYWVQDNIRYVAIEDGWRGFIPYPAPEICDKRYGDCKDMTHLMYEMMRISNLQAEHAWVGTRSLPYSYEETPCLSTDNHLVLSLIVDGKTYILDATDSYIPFGYPTAFILSKQTLFKSSDGSYVLYEIPEFKAEDCVVKNVHKITSDGRNINGVSQKMIESFEYSNFHNRYGNANLEKEEIIDKYLEIGDNNFNMKSSTITELSPRGHTKFDYEYNLPDFVKAFNQTFYINLNLTRPYVNGLLQKNRMASYKIKYKKTFQSTVEFAVPEGKKITNLPLDILFKSEFGSCTAKYIIENNVVKYTREITIDKLSINSDQFQEWNEFVKVIIKVYNTSIEYK